MASWGLRLQYSYLCAASTVPFQPPNISFWAQVLSPNRSLLIWLCWLSGKPLGSLSPQCWSYRWVQLHQTSVQRLGSKGWSSCSHSKDFTQRATSLGSNWFLLKTFPWISFTLRMKPRLLQGPLSVVPDHASPTFLLFSKGSPARSKSQLSQGSTYHHFFQKSF